MFVVGEVFTDLVLSVGAKINEQTRVLDGLSYQLPGGAGHVARLLIVYSRNPVYLVASWGNELTLLEGDFSRRARQYPARVTLVQDGNIQRYIEPVFDFLVRRPQTFNVPAQVANLWKTSSVVYVCSHGYVDMSLVLDALDEVSAEPRTYLVSGDLPLFYRRFHGPCYFFTNRESSLMNRITASVAFRAENESFKELAAVLAKFLVELRKINDVRGLFITMDRDGVLVAGMPLEQDHYLCAEVVQYENHTLCVAAYPSRVKYLVDSTGCGDAFMVGVGLNLDTSHPIRSGLMAARYCAQCVGTCTT